MNNSVDPQLKRALATLREEYSIPAGLRFVPGAPAGSFEVRGKTIYYDTQAQALRGLGAVLAGHGDCREQTAFTTFGIMLDCSRNAVMTVAHFKGWLRRLALLGYNMAMLYTEDTYELPGEPYFGYLRGRYSLAELKEINDYAARLGIEMIGCIQTLGHLEQILKWSAYRDVKDTGSVLMVGEEKSYALIEKMVAQFAKAFGSRRLHIGMDETHDLGRGRFMDQFGYRRGFDLFNEHLKRVVAICQRHGLQPMLWSDMYFRLGSKTQEYYDTNCRVPADVKAKIPAAARLVYWDYYHDQQDFYAAMLRIHRDLGSEPVMASGVWTWGVPWYWHAKTEQTVRPCLAACRQAGVKEVFFTLWGDDGAYCEFDSALAGLCFAADEAYSSAGGVGLRACADPNKKNDTGRDACATEARTKQRYAAICGDDYDAVLAVSAIQDKLNPAMLLWDDPLLRIAWKNEDWLAVVPAYRQALRQATGHAQALVKFLLAKLEFNRQLDAGRRPSVKPVVRVLDKLAESFREQWYRRNKPQGFETIQLRLGGQRARWLELERRLAKKEPLPELQERPKRGLSRTPTHWRGLAGAGII